VTITMMPLPTGALAALADRRCLCRGAVAGWGSGHSGLGQFHRDPQVDFAEDMVERRVP